MHQKRKMVLPSDQDAMGRNFGKEERALLEEVLSSGILNGIRGKQVPLFEEEFAAKYAVPFCRAVASGTAACHTAIAGFDLEPGDEVITTPITDMGAISPILYQQLIPVFADVDPLTLNVTAKSIEERISDKTKAIVVTHLFGNPCEMLKIMELARGRGIPVIEDCAQAFLATVDGQLTGTFGEVGCFSIQQGKHMTAGEGGMVISTETALARRLKLFSDKGWPYGEEMPDHEFLALNYRMSELQAAIARGQLTKLDGCVANRVENATKMHALLEGVPGLTLPIPEEGASHVYWKYPLIVDDSAIRGGSDALGAALKERGIYCVPRYIKKPAFECQVVRERITFGKSQMPYQHRRKEEPDAFPGAYQGLKQVVVLPWNEQYTEEHLHYLADNIKESVACLTT